MDFGSVPAASARADQELFRSAAGRLGRPVVVQDPHAARGPSGPGVFSAPGADHRLLLPAGQPYPGQGAGAEGEQDGQRGHQRRDHHLGSGIATVPRGGQG